MQSIEDIKKEVAERWRTGQYLEHGVEVPTERYEHLPWIPYEGYMEARLVNWVPGEVGQIMVRFPVEGSESNELHIHPLSDRIILVIEGSGEFVSIRDGVEVRHALQPGDCIYLPRGTRHTFFAGPLGLLVESIHNPWVPLEDPQCLVY